MDYKWSDRRLLKRWQTLTQAKFLNDVISKLLQINAIDIITDVIKTIRMVKIILVVKTVM